MSAAVITMPIQMPEAHRAPAPAAAARHTDESDAVAALVRQAQKGGRAAFQDLVTMHRRRVMGTISRLIGRPDDVEDVAQEVFLRLYLSLDQLRDPDFFSAWLYRLVVNASYDYLRRHRRGQVSLMADLPDEQVVAADAAQARLKASDDVKRRQIREQVEEVLRPLSKGDRMLLLLKEVEGLSIRELGHIYNAREDAIKVRLFRARQRAVRAMEHAPQA